MSLSCHFCAIRVFRWLRACIVTQCLCLVVNISRDQSVESLSPKSVREGQKNIRNKKVEAFLWPPLSRALCKVNHNCIVRCNQDPARSFGLRRSSSCSSIVHHETFLGCVLSALELPGTSFSCSRVPSELDCYDIVIRSLIWITLWTIECNRELHHNNKISSGCRSSRREGFLFSVSQLLALYRM